MKVIIGIDEAGRGPLAGPVTVGAFSADESFRKWILRNIFDGRLRDSKKLSEVKREEIYEKFLVLKKEGKVSFSVSHISNKIIDKNGISGAVRLGVYSCLKRLQKLQHTSNTQHRVSSIRLDGLLKAPEEFKDQKTIIKGDEKDVFIACASIVAKVSRDRLMRRLSRKYSLYKLDIHKGYGTKMHRSLIKKYKASPIHRQSYLKNI